MADGPIAFLGPGQMGLPMVRRLVGVGHEVVACARRPESRAACVAAGATATADVREAVDGASAVVVCLFADPQVRAAAFGPQGFLDAMSPGSLLVLHTTGSPATSRELADRSSPDGIRVVDAPVSGSATDIDEGHVTVLLGGEPDAVAAARLVVSAYGDPILEIGPLGSAMVVKLLNNALFAAQLQLAGEVERVAASFGVTMADVAPAIMQSSGASYAMGVVSRFGSSDAVVAAAGHFLAKDLAVVNEVVDELGLDLGVIGAANADGPLVFRPRDE